jgi:hypothetical protein
MPFRDDRDALLARNHALEQQLEDAEQALLDKEQELEDAKKPPAPVVQQAVKGKSHVHSRPSQPADIARAHGASLAEDLISDDKGVASSAQRELRTAAPLVSDAAAKVLVRYLRGGGPKAQHVCRALADADAPSFGGKSWSRLFKAFTKLTGSKDSSPLAQAAMQRVVSRGPDQGYQRRREEAAAASTSTSLPRRILSVMTRAWVIVVLGIPALFGVILIATTPSLRIHAILALLSLAAVVVVIDAFTRRCPRCRKLLAGKRLSIVSDNYGGHVLSWSCVFCDHRWKT